MRCHVQELTAPRGGRTSQGFCQTNTDSKISGCLNDATRPAGNVHRVRVNKSNVILPIGRAAHIAFQIEAMRAECCAAAQLLANETEVNEEELEESALLDDALAKAQRLLKATVAEVMISRLKRRSRITERED